jgi:hypothetical protein
MPLSVRVVRIQLFAWFRAFYNMPSSDYRVSLSVSPHQHSRPLRRAL